MTEEPRVPPSRPPEPGAPAPSVTAAGCRRGCCLVAEVEGGIAKRSFIARPWCNEAAVPDPPTALGQRRLRERVWLCLRVRAPRQLPRDGCEERGLVSAVSRASHRPREGGLLLGEAAPDPPIPIPRGCRSFPGPSAASCRAGGAGAPSSSPGPGGSRVPMLWHRGEAGSTLASPPAARKNHPGADGPILVPSQPMDTAPAQPRLCGEGDPVLVSSLTFHSANGSPAPGSLSLFLSLSTHQFYSEHSASPRLPLHSLRLPLATGSSITARLRHGDICAGGELAARHLVGRRCRGGTWRWLCWLGVLVLWRDRSHWRAGAPAVVPASPGLAGSPWCGMELKALNSLIISFFKYFFFISF